jgi:hypothetical protein
MKCQDFREMIDSYLSDELLTETNHNVLRHMENCADCRQVIEARREIRTRLRSAVTNNPQYQIGKNFEHTLRTQLKYAAFEKAELQTASWFGFKSLMAVVAGLLITATLGFFLFNSGSSSAGRADINGPEEKNTTDAEKYTVPALPTNHLVNIASGDHEHCAIRHKIGERPISLAQASAKYAGLEKIVVKPVAGALNNYKLVEAHACRYKKTRFAHLVLQNAKETLSVLVTDADETQGLKSSEILNFSTEKYEIARFDVRDKAVFVVSNLDQQTNNKAAEALYKPMRNHFEENEILQTAVLMFY